ncbi:MAG: pyrroline-5-carboxylate reductase [Gammaproteobacteria bacterium]
MDIKISFLGAGNMANCLITSLLQQGYPARQLAASNRHPEKLVPLKTIGVHTTTDNTSIVDSDLIVLAVKPQHMKNLLQEINPHLQSKLVVSIAAGLTTAQIESWLSKPINICRAMPNTPARYGIGITGLYASNNINDSEKKQIERLFQAVGDTVWLQTEEQMNIVTALSGSGPAYFFYWLEALIQGATQLGLPESVAKQLALKTAYGASVMALSAPESLSALREQVTSKGGTTESGLSVLDRSNLFGLISNTLQAATERGKTLSALYSDPSQREKK